MSARTAASRALAGGPSRRFLHASTSRNQITANVTAPQSAASPLPTASSSDFAMKAEDTRSSTSSATVSSSIILSRLPVVLREPSAFETAYFDYNRQLSEALQQPFVKEFYFKKGSALERNFTEEQAQYSAGFTGIGKSKKDAESSEAATTSSSGVAEGVVETQPLPRTTEADTKEDVCSLDRKLDRTLYLVVKQTGSDTWTFPSKTLEGKENLHRVAPKAVTESLGEDMDIWLVSHLPIGMYKPSEAQKTYFLSGHILAGNAQLAKDNGIIDDFRWLTREEIQAVLKPEYWDSVNDFLDL